MSRLVSFQRSADDISAGVGYYGETEKNLPVRKIDELENISKRFKTGTDIFIYGFNGDGLWRENIFLELFENFLVAIHRDKLRVKIQTIDIDKNNLGSLLRKYEDKLQKASNYYRALTGDGVKISPMISRKNFLRKMSATKAKTIPKLSGRPAILKLMGLRPQ